MADAVVIGSGPNGLMAANVLADSGWEVTVLEAAGAPGGAVRSAELGEPGFRQDMFSAFYPLAAASPYIEALELERHGLRWRRSDVVLAHPLLDGRCPALHSSAERTAENLESFGQGDGDAWLELYDLWRRIGTDLLGLLFTPFPQVRPAGRMLRRLGPEGLLRFLRFGMLSVRRLGEERFRGPGGPSLLSGNALHADLSPEMLPSAIYGWVLASLGQEVGFPAPEGGSGALSSAMARRLESRGGRVICDQRATAIRFSGGRAVAVQTTSGDEFAGPRAVLAAVGAPQLYHGLIGRDRLPARFLEDLGRFQYDSGTVKVDWTLNTPIPWSAEDARRAGTIHIAEGVDALTKQASELTRGLIPETPYLVMGQYAGFDPTRAPADADTAWAYTHVPQEVKGDAGGGSVSGRWNEEETAAFAERVEQEVEKRAPGFRDSIRTRHVFTPPTMERENPNLVNGAINGGTAQLHQQLVFRPVPGLGRPETPFPGLFLASASTHPGGGVHGACGALSARAALNADRGHPGTRLLRALNVNAQTRGSAG